MALHATILFMPGAENGTPVGSGFTEGELKFASFWVRNELVLRRAVYALLIAVNAALWGYAAWGFLDAYAISYPRESRIPADIAANEVLAKQLASNRPQNVRVGRVEVFANTEGRLDIVVPVENANAQWVAEFTYRFNVSGELTPARSGVLLPGERSYLGEFGFTQQTKGAKTAVLTVDALRWVRLDPKVVGSDYEEWLSRRNAFRISDVTQSNAIEIGGKKVLRTNFTFTNPTAYGYWSIPLYVLLKRGDAIVAANRVVLSRVASGETRTVSMDWFEQLPSVTDTEIVPVVDYLDPGAYMK